MASVGMWAQFYRNKGDTSPLAETGQATTTGTYTSVAGATAKAPAGTQWLKVYLFAQPGAAGYFDNMYVRRKNTGQVIVDGAIKANHLDVNDINASQRIVVGTGQVTGLGTLATKNQVGNNDITTIDGGKITTGTIDANNVNVVNLKTANLAIAGTSWDNMFANAKFLKHCYCGCSSGLAYVNGFGSGGMAASFRGNANGWGGQQLHLTFPYYLSTSPIVLLTMYQFTSNTYNWRPIVMGTSTGWVDIGVMDASGNMRDANSATWGICALIVSY